MRTPTLLAAFALLSCASTAPTELTVASGALSDFSGLPAVCFPQDGALAASATAHLRRNLQAAGVAVPEVRPSVTPHVLLRVSADNRQVTTHGILERPYITVVMERHGFNLPISQVMLVRSGGTSLESEVGAVSAVLKSILLSGIAPSHAVEVHDVP